MTGDLNPLLCNETTRINDSFLLTSADCGGDNPEVSCNCCRECCNDITGCPYDTGLTACEREVKTFEVLNCECSLVNDEELVDNNEGGNGGDAYRATCTGVQFCQYCDEDSEECALRSSGWYYDGVGTLESDWTRYEYITGSHKGRSVTLKGSADQSTCEVIVDDIYPCRYCRRIFCTDGYETIEVACENVPDGGFYSGCKTNAETDTFGVIQALHPQYELEYCQIYHPGYCSFLKDYLENNPDVFNEEYETSCQCNEPGLEVACQHDGCLFCHRNSNSTTSSSTNVTDYDSSIMSSHEEDYCYLFGITFIIQEGTDKIVGLVQNYLLFPSPIFPDASVTTTTTTTTNATTNMTSSMGNVTDVEATTTPILDNETTPVLLTYKSDRVDNTCIVEVNGVVCTTCNFTTCEHDGSNKVMVDCENTILGIGAKYDRCKNETGPGLLGPFTQGDEFPPCTPYNVTMSPYKDWNKRHMVQ